MSSIDLPRFALDQNFPTPIIDALRAYIREAELVPIGAIHPRLPTLDDWQLLVALSQQTPACAGLVTTDNSMLLQERELSILIQTRLTLVVADAAGDDPLKATGLLLAHLPWIAKQRHRHQAQVWVLRTTSRPAEDPWDTLRRVATRQRLGDHRALYERHKIESLPEAARQLLVVPGSRAGSPGQHRPTKRRRR